MPLGADVPLAWATKHARRLLRPRRRHTRWNQSRLEAATSCTSGTWSSTSGQRVEVLALLERERPIDLIRAPIRRSPTVRTTSRRRCRVFEDFERQRGRHPEICSRPRGEVPPTGRRVRPPQHEQGLRRLAERASAEGARDPLGVRRRQGLERRPRGPADRSQRSTSSARRRPRPTSWPRSTGSTSDSRSESSVAAASTGPSRTAESNCTDSCPTSSNVLGTGTTYKIFGYKGKQVRDNIHAKDVCRALHRFYEKPRPGEVYNLGGGRDNSVSLIREAASHGRRSRRRPPGRASTSTRTGRAITSATSATFGN